MGTWNTNEKPILTTIPLSQTAAMKAVSTGYAPLFLNSVTTAPTANYTYQAVEAGTYSNLKLANGSAASSIVVSTDDIANPFVFLVYNAVSNSWTKKVSQIDLSDYTPIDEFNSIGFVAKNWFLDPSCEAAFLRQSDIGKSSSSLFRITPFVSVKQGDTLPYKGVATAAMACIGFYASKSFTDVIATGSNPLGVRTGQVNESVTVPVDCYVVACTRVDIGGEWLFSTPNGKAVDISQVPGMELYAERDDILVNSITEQYSDQLFNVNSVVPSNPSISGWIEDVGISQTNGALVTASQYRVANVPITDPAATQITFSGLVNATSKVYRFVDASGNVIAGSFAFVTATTQTRPIPAGAKIFQVTFKTSADPTTAGNALMINYGATALPFAAYTVPKVSGLNGRQIQANLFVYRTGLSWAQIGDSITFNQTANNGGYAAVVQQALEFTQSTIYGYSGSPLTFGAEPTNPSILASTFSNTWVKHDVFTLLAGTNDFRLNMPVGTSNDYINNTGGTTFYGALRMFIDKCYTLNPLAKILLMTPLQRNNSGYTSWSTNTAGFTMTDYCNAIRWVAERESLVLVDLFKEGGINLRNLAQTTSDGLHPNAFGYKVMAQPLITGMQKLVRITQ